MNEPESSWAVEEHLDKVYQRGRLLRRRHRAVRAMGMGGVVSALAAVLALQGAPGSERQVTASGPILNASTTIPSAEPAPDSGTMDSATVPTTTSNVDSASGGALATPGPTSAGQPVSPGGTPTPTPPRPSTVPAGADPVTITVTEADGNASYTLRPGDQLVLRLSGSSGDYSQPQSSDRGVLRQTSGSSSPDGGAQATFLAVGDGSAAVRYSWDAKCRRSTPRCMVATIGYTVSVSVGG